MKVALTVPVLPSVTVTSLMETDGGTDGQDWSLISTETLFAAGIGRGGVEPAVAVEVAGRHRRGHGPAAKFSGGRERAVAAAAEHADVCRQQQFAVAMSSLPSRLKSPRTTEAGRAAGGVVLGGREAAHAVAQQHADVVAVDVRRHQVDVAVAVHVARGHRVRDSRRWRRSEAAWR